MRDDRLGREGRPHSCRPGCLQRAARIGEQKGLGGGGCPQGGSGLVLGSGFLPWPCFGEEHLLPHPEGHSHSRPVSWDPRCPLKGHLPPQAPERSWADRSARLRETAKRTFLGKPLGRVQGPAMWQEAHSATARRGCPAWGQGAPLARPPRCCHMQHPPPGTTLHVSTCFRLQTQVHSGVSPAGSDNKQAPLAAATATQRGLGFGPC